MIRKILALAAAPAAAAALALAAAAPASAASVPQGTFGTVAGDAFLSAFGPRPAEHPASSDFTKFTQQTGSESNTSFALTEVAPSVYTVLWTGRPDVHGKYLASDFRGGVEFFTTPDLWRFSGGKLTDLSTGRILCVGPTFGVTGAVSTVPASSTAACTDLEIVTP
jgi:uncharacterized protein YciI